MATISTARRHPDEPVEVFGAFATRIQSVELGDQLPTRNIDEMGNYSHAGAVQDAKNFTGSLSSFPINNQLELLLGAYSGSAGSTVDLVQYKALEHGVTIKTPRQTMSGCQVIGIEYATQAPNGEFRATFRLLGQTFTAESNEAISVTEPSGIGAYTYKDVSVSINGTTGVRVLGVTARADIPNQRLYELNNQNPVATVFDSPNVSCDIDFYESDSAAGEVEMALATPGDIILRVATNVKTITLKNMVWTGKTIRGTVRGWASRRYSYVSKGDAATGGLSIA
jgi:hypothetical protein